MKNNKTPRFAKWVLSCVFRKADRLHRLGDFEEVFQHIAETDDRTHAWRWYWWQVIRSIPEMIKNSIYWGGAMFRNYLMIALRNLRHNKVYSFIHIAGVAVSLAACILILKYVSFELSYDRFHENVDNLYRLTNDRYQDGELIQHGVITYPSVAKTMQADYPEVLNYTRVDQFSQLYVRRNEVSFNENIVFADSAFLTMFSFPLIIGNTKTALSEPFSILLSESLAEKYFGSNWRGDDILGEILNVDNRFDLTITGVFENIPTNSHMTFDLLVSYITLGNVYGRRMVDSWTNSNFMGYLQLVPGTDRGDLEQKFVDFSQRYFKGNEVTGYVENFYLQPLKDIHLYSDYEYDETWIHGNGTTVKALLLIAGVILFITWVNFVNLSTARSMERAKEVGMRKVVGANRSQIIKQFLLESLLFNVVGFFLAIAMVALIQSHFSQLLGVEFSSALFSNTIGFAFLALFLVGTIISGLYPALVTSTFQVLSVLKGKLKSTGHGRILRKGLVVFQFALSFALIAGTYAVYLQIKYMMNEDLGMNVDQILVVGGPRLTSWDSTYWDNISSFKAELLRYPAISHVTASQRLPGRRTGRIFNVQRLSGDSERRFTTSDIGVDHDYFETFDMDIIAGRGFEHSDHHMDFNAIRSVVLNESAAKLMGFEKPEDAFLQGIRFWRKDWEIVGVIEDHHQQSLHVPAEPIIFTPQYSTGNFFFIKLDPRDLSQSIATVKDKYLEFFPGNSFNTFFLDEFFNRQYQADRNFYTAFTLFVTLAVLLASLGLFGLSFFTIAQRTKEIGVRKVVGATTGKILSLLFSDFSRLVLIAALLASPLTYFAIKRWLSGYAYRIDVGWSMFVLPILIVLAIASFTVSYQTVRAAKANPVEALKYE